MEGFLNPEKILKQLKLKPNMIAADFGSGSGGWVIPLAKKLEDGKVFAIDILEEPLSVLRAKAKSEKIFNIQTISVDVEKSINIAQGSCDLILITNLLFQIEDKRAVFGNAQKLLKNGGKVLVIDWKEDASMGPAEGRVSAEEMAELAKDFKLALEKEFDASAWHWGLILQKSS